MNQVGFSSIESERIILRKFKETDIENFYKYRSNPKVSLYQGWDNYKYEQAIEFIEKQKNFEPNIPGTWFQVAIELKNNNNLIGDCAIHTLKEDPSQVEVGFTIEPIYQGKGYAVEALRCLFDYLFNTLSKHRVIARTDARNIRSINLLEKLGMRREGYFIKNAWYKGEYTDEYLYAMLKEEWK